MALFKLSMLVIDGDVESNPGPGYKIQKSVSGSFHQGDVKFGYSAGTQCSCNALYAICFSAIKKVSIWKYWDLDYILEHSDTLFVSLGIARALSMNELPTDVEIEKHMLKIEMLDNSVGPLGQNSIFSEHVSMFDIGNGLIFTTDGYCFSLIWSKNGVFLFDSHSRDSNGCFTDAGSSIVLSFITLFDVGKYIKTEYSKHLSNFHESQFELQYVKVTATSSAMLEISHIIKKQRKNVKDTIYVANKYDEIKQQRSRKRAEIFGTPEHDKIKKRVCVKYANIKGTAKHVNLKSKKRAEYDLVNATSE